MTVTVPKGADKGRWVAVAVIVALTAVLVAGIVELTRRGSGGGCTVGSCPSGKTCDTATGKCLPAATTSCLVTGCPKGRHCDPASGQCQADCTAASCPKGQACGPAGVCVCPGGGIPVPDGSCQAPVSKQPKNCQELKTSIATDATAARGDPGVYYCTGVAGTDAGLTTGVDGATDPPTADQIYAEHFDDPRLKRSFPGNQTEGSYDPSKVSVINASGCLAPSQAGDTDGTGNCSRGVRLTSLFVGRPSDNRTAEYDEVRDISDWQAVGDSFVGQHKIWGSSGSNWTSAGCSAGNIYPRPGADGDKVEHGVRMRVTGDLWGVGYGDGPVPTSSDGVPLAPGLYRADQQADCGSTDPSTTGPNEGCGGTKLTCAGSQCTKTGKPVACTDTITLPGGKPKKVSTCDPAGSGASDPCLLQTQCDAFRERQYVKGSKPSKVNPKFEFPPLAWNQGVTDKDAADPAGLMTEDDRTAFARVGATLATQDFWGPGEYEFTLVVPPVPHAYDTAPVATLPNPNVDIDRHCLSGYVMPLWMFQSLEVYNAYQPYDPKGPPESSVDLAPESGHEGPEVARGAAASAAAATGGAAGPVRWMPSEQATWSPHTTNVCAGDQGEGELSRIAAKLATDKIAGNPVDYWTPRTSPSSAGAYPKLDWYGPATVKSGGKVAQTCVPNNDSVGGGGQGAEAGDAVTQEAVSSHTFGLLGCGVPNDSAPTGVCAADGDCPLGLKCTAVGAHKRCMPEAASALTAPLTAYYGAVDADPATLTNNCLAFQQSWQTGKFGSQWCGNQHSYGGDCVPPATDTERNWAKNPGVQLASVQLPSGKLTVPSSAYAMQSAELGGNLNGGTWGGNDSFMAVGAEIDIELPANTPVTSLNANRALGAWGMETFNANTWQLDNNSYTPEGPTPWYTQAMVTHDWPAAVPKEWPEGGIDPATCEAEFREKRSFVSKKDPAGTPSKGMDQAYTPVTYKVVWWADEKDPTESYVQFWVDGKLVYSTNRFVPTRACRWVVGPFPARWGGGYQDFKTPDPRAPDGVEARISNSQAFDYVYVDLLSASFKPFNETFLPAGKTVADLKLRSIANTYDQRLVGVSDADIAAANTPGTNVIVAGAGDPDKAWAGMTCRKGGDGTSDCEIRCGMHQLYDWATVAPTVFAAAKYDPSKTPTQVACKGAKLSLAPAAGAAVAVAAAATTSRSTDKAWLGVTIGSAVALAGVVAVCIWLFVAVHQSGKTVPAIKPHQLVRPTPAVAAAGPAR